MTVYEGGGEGSLHGGHNAVELLRERLGIRYQAGLDEGRAEIARVLAGELNVGHDEAERMTRQLIDSGEIRFIPGIERDDDRNIPPVDDSRVDMGEYHRGNADAGAPGVVLPELNDRAGGRDSDARADADGTPLPAGLHPGFAAPIAANNPSGSTPGTVPLAAGLPFDADTGDHLRTGYWDFGSGAVGVRPSSTRKGQVEPRGT